MGLHVIAEETFRLENVGIIVSYAITAEVIGAGQQQGVIRNGTSLVYKLFCGVVGE